VTAAIAAVVSKDTIGLYYEKLSEGECPPEALEENVSLRLSKGDIPSIQFLLTQKPPLTINVRVRYNHHDIPFPSIDSTK